MLFEWRIQDVERKAEKAYSRLYEIDTLRSELVSLEHTVRELSSTCDGLRSELQTCQDKIMRLEQREDASEV